MNRPQRFWDHRKFWFQVCLCKLNFGSGSLFSLEDNLSLERPVGSTNFLHSWNCNLCIYERCQGMERLLDL